LKAVNRAANWLLLLLLLLLIVDRMWIVDSIAVLAHLIIYCCTFKVLNLILKKK